MSAIYSMTGYATAQSETADGTAFTLTLKGVNHRFLDLSLRLPANTDALEAALRAALKQALRRGHVDVTLQVGRFADAVSQLRINHELLSAHVAAFRQTAQLHGIASDPDLNAILRLPGVLRTDAPATPAPPSVLESAALALLPTLLGSFNEVRAAEGATLAAELRSAMQRLQAQATEVASLREGARAALAERLTSRIADLLGDTAIPQERILAEAALLAERSDIDEELVRLHTHLHRFLKLLEAGGEVGKPLDFLLQELNREANTLLSKTGGASPGGLRITELGLQMKHEIEKVREQVQNLE